MDADQRAEIAKDGVTYFSTGGGAVYFLITIIGLAVSVPTGVTIPLVILGGLIYGGFGMWSRYKHIQAAALQRQEERQRQNEQNTDAVRVMEDISNAFKAVHSVPCQLVIEREVKEDNEINADDVFIPLQRSLYLNTPHFFSEQPQAANDDEYELGIKFQNNGR